MVLLAFAVSPALAQAEQKQPSAKATGKVYEWQSKDGLRYQFYLPKKFDPQQPINLTFILHGSNLDRRWGFANHKAGQFRADDFVVSPDGTTSNGSGGFNSLQGKKDLERLHALHQELQEMFNIRATYLYGHSQGSFFSFYYAGAYPDDVQGLVGQASGVWIGTQATKKHHHQAVVLMHGTKDPVVPYGQSVGGLDFYVKAKYPHVRLRSLDGWNHWPTQLQTEQQLAWCEGMTTDDPDRMIAALTTLSEAKGVVDPVALYEVAARVAAIPDMNPNAVKMANAAIKEVGDCATKHVKAITKSSGKKTKKLVDKPWIGHVPLFLRHFKGVPECDAFAEQWQAALAKQQSVADKNATDFWRNADRSPKKTFGYGLKIVNAAFLTTQASNERMLGKLEEWHKAGKKAGISKGDLKSFKSGVPVLRSARKKGRAAFEKVSKKFR